MDKIAKDVGDIQSRLIDHRPITQGEIRYFVREFEEKRGYREGRLLENVNKMVVEANEQVMPKCLQGLQEHLADVSTRLEAANHMAQRVQQRELQSHPSAQLQQASAAQEKEAWEEFLREQQRLKDQVDEEHAKAVGRLSTQYSEMKKDLEKLSPL